MENRNLRTAPAIRPDPIILGTVALLTLAMLACGESDTGDSRVAVAAPVPASTTPVEVREPATPESAPVVRRTATYAEAEEAYRGRRYTEAVDLFESYVEHRPNNPFGHYMLGLSAWKAGQAERAEVAFLAAIERDPTNVKSHLNLARVLLDLGRNEDALTHVRAALELDSGIVDGHRLMGRVLTVLRRPAEAIESYRMALSIDTTDTWSMNNMGLMLIRQGRFEEALGPLSLATTLQPGVAVFQNNLGVALERTGRIEDAVVAYQAAVETESGHPTAGASRDRVSKLTQRPDAVFVSLEEISVAFAEEVRGWKSEREERIPVVSEGVIEP